MKLDPGSSTCRPRILENLALGADSAQSSLEDMDIQQFTGISVINLHYLCINITLNFANLLGHAHFVIIITITKYDGDIKLLL